MIPFTPRWRDARDRQRRARAYVGAALREPADDDVAWLAEAAAAGDDDHARWELRYARMAVALFVAERDSLDDRTGSEVAAAIRAALAHDARVAPDLRLLAERQFNERLNAYREAFFARGPAAATTMGRVLLAFASDGARSAGTPLARAAAITNALALECNAALREAYGTAHLPEDVAPSAVAGQ